MTERDKASLFDIARFTETILQLAPGMNEASFQADMRTQVAVLYELTASGETVKRLSQEFRARHPDISWRNMTGIRDKLIHDSARVDAI